MVQAIKTEKISQKFGFTLMKIRIFNPILKFYPRPGFEEYFLIDLGDIEITNTQQTDNSRGNEQV